MACRAIDRLRLLLLVVDFLARITCCARVKLEPPAVEKTADVAHMLIVLSFNAGYASTLWISLMIDGYFAFLITFVLN